MRVLSAEAFLAGLITCVLVWLFWLIYSRRNTLPKPGYVYVNQDGSVREVSPGEQAYLSQEFAGGDGGRPYIKSSLASRDGWGSLSGFMDRRHVPAGVTIHPVHPEYDAREAQLGFDPTGSNRAAGDLIEARPDGSTCCTPNPTIDPKERFERMRRWQLEHQREREQLGAWSPPAKQ